MPSYVAKRSCDSPHPARVAFQFASRSSRLAPRAPWLTPTRVFDATAFAPRHDFCLTLPYGFIVAFGGLIGFLSKGSFMSLLAGGGSGALLVHTGFQSLGAYKQSQDGGAPYEPTPFTKQSLVVALILAAVMAKRFYSDGAPFMPAGLVFYMSAGMSAFYLLKLQDKSHSSKKSE